MRINHVAIYMVIIGWAGVLLAMLMPVLLSLIPDLHFQSDLYGYLWIVGAIVSTMSGIYLVWDKRHNYGQIAAIFLVVGIGSLGYALIDALVSS